MGSNDTKPSDPIRERIVLAVDEFRSLGAFVTLPINIVDQLRSMVMPEAEKQIRSGERSLDDVANGAVDFLLKTVVMRAGPDAIPRPGLDFLRHGVPTDIAIRDIQAARKRHWCTIWPFCSTED